MVQISHFLIDRAISVEKYSPVSHTIVQLRNADCGIGNPKSQIQNPKSNDSPHLLISVNPVLCESLQLEMTGRNESQKRSACFPIPDIKINISFSVDPLLDFLGEMGVAEDDNLEPLQKLPTGKGFEGRRGGRLGLVMILLIACVAHPLGNFPGNPGTYEMDQTIGPGVFENLSEDSIRPLARIGQVAVGDKGPLSLQPLFVAFGINLDVHSELLREE